MSAVVCRSAAAAWGSAAGLGFRRRGGDRQAHGQEEGQNQGSPASVKYVHNSSFPAPQGVCAGRSGEMTVPGYTFPPGEGQVKNPERSGPTDVPGDGYPSPVSAGNTKAQDSTPPDLLDQSATQRPLPGFALEKSAPRRYNGKYGAVR